MISNIDHTVPEVVCLLVGGDGGVHDGGGGQADAGLLCGDVDGLLVVVGGHRNVPLPHRAAVGPPGGLVVVKPPLVTFPRILLFLHGSSEG